MPPAPGTRQICKKCGQPRKGHVCTAVPHFTQASQAIPMNTTTVVIEDDALGDPNVSSTSPMEDLFGTSSNDEEENLPLTKRKERKRVKDEDSSEDEGNESTITMKEKADNVPIVTEKFENTPNVTKETENQTSLPIYHADKTKWSECNCFSHGYLDQMLGNMSSLPFYFDKLSRLTTLDPTSPLYLEISSTIKFSFDAGRALYGTTSKTKDYDGFQLGNIEVITKQHDFTIYQAKKEKLKDLCCEANCELCKELHTKPQAKKPKKDKKIPLKEPSRQFYFEDGSTFDGSSYLVTGQWKQLEPLSLRVFLDGELNKKVAPTLSYVSRFNEDKRRWDKYIYDFCNLLQYNTITGYIRRFKYIDTTSLTLTGVNHEKDIKDIDKSAFFPPDSSKVTNWTICEKDSKDSEAESDLLPLPDPTGLHTCKLNEMYVYHGTSIDTIKAIIENGMIKEMAENRGDPTASKKYSANAHGIGIYFARYLDYSINNGYARPMYEKKNKNGEWIPASSTKDAMRERKCVLMCRAVMGTSQTCSNAQQSIPDLLPKSQLRFNSFCNAGVYDKNLGKNVPNVYVHGATTDGQCYPEFLLNFVRDIK